MCRASGRRTVDKHLLWTSGWWTAASPPSKWCVGRDKTGDGRGWSISVSDDILIHSSTLNSPGTFIGEKSAHGAVSRSFQEICSAEILQEPVLELSGKIKRRPLKVPIDSRSTGSFISNHVVVSLYLKVVENGNRQKLILPDKSIIWAGGWVDFLLTCGEYVRRISARLFPSLHKELILGMPWLVMEDPDISWRNRTVAIQQKESFIQLPLLRPAGNIPQVDEINMCSAKQMSRWFWRRKMERVFLGFIRAVSGEA